VPVLAIQSANSRLYKKRLSQSRHVSFLSAPTQPPPSRASQAALPGAPQAELFFSAWPPIETPYVYGDFTREIERWALFMGGPWS
jgi:hypothetical protein